MYDYFFKLILRNFFSFYTGHLKVLEQLCAYHDMKYLRQVLKHATEGDNILVKNYFRTVVQLAKLFFGKSGEDCTKKESRGPS